MIRVTADSNIYISAFQFSGAPLQLLTLAAEDRDLLRIKHYGNVRIVKVAEFLKILPHF